MPKAKFNSDATTVISGKDGIIIRKHIAGFAGGCVLDMTGRTEKVIPCGLPIATDGKGTFKPVFPVDDAANGGFILPAGFHYAGLCGASEMANKPISVITAGVVNEMALLLNLKEMCPTPNRVLTLSDLTALKSALLHIIWEHDEVGDPTVVTLSGLVYIDSAEDFTANFDKLADYYKKNPNAPGHDGVYPDVKWVVGNFSGLAGTMTIAYNGAVKCALPITKESTYVIIDPLSDLGVEYASFDLTKLVITVGA